MMPPDLLADDPAIAAERAFVTSPLRSFQGKALQPFSIARQFAAQALGNKILCGNHRSESFPCRDCDKGRIPAPKGAAKKKGPKPAETTECPACAGSGLRWSHYPGMFLDIAVLLWLCDVDRREVAVAINDPEEARDKALAWAEQRGLALNSPALREADGLYWSIIHELHSAQFKNGKDAPPGNASGGHHTDA